MSTSGLNPTGAVVLLVDDEDSLRDLVRLILESRGYVVLNASNGREGLDVCRTHPGRIDILVSDVAMPELDGLALAAGARELRPALKVLFMSGDSPEVALGPGNSKGTAFLQKPFSPRVLEQMVQTTLDGYAPPS